MKKNSKNRKTKVVNNNWETSKYWLGTSIIEKMEEAPGDNLIELVEYKRAIANFVRITTGKDIPVRFSTGNDSYTDGKEVTISSKLNDTKFDCTAGLALHEAAHVLLTDFEVIKKLDTCSYLTNHIPGVLAARYPNASTSDLLLAKGRVRSQLKNILNVIEDRRIDFFIYNSAPGYRGYYLSMYAEYFNSPAIDLALQRRVKNNSTFDDYMFHIINLMNPNFDSTVLPKLQAIVNTIDLYNIGRVKSTAEALEISIAVASILEDEITEISYLDQSKPKDPKSENGSSGSNSDKDDENYDISDTVSGSDSESKEDVDSSDNDSDVDSIDNDSDVDIDDMPELTAGERKLLDKLNEAYEDQKSFIDGKIDKKSTTKKEAGILSAIDSINIDFETVNIKGKPTSTIDGTHFDQAPVKCIVINQINESIIESINGVFRYSDIRNHKEFNKLLSGERAPSPYERDFKAIQNGIRIGTMLGRKLKIRTDENSLKSSRLNSGKIDRRLIAELGYGAEAVFSKITTKTVKPVDIHISIDASGSMSGSKYQSALTMASAVAKAASMIPNVNVVISFRTTTNINNIDYPVLVIGYDSKVNTISHLYRYMYLVYAGGSTPEGLCIEAILKRFKNTNNQSDGIFINVSDGMPTFNTGGRGKNRSVFYGGDYAIRHTQNQCKALRAAGYKILSYFVSNSRSEKMSYGKHFKEMYGNDSSFIDPTNLAELSKSINELLLRPVYANQ